MLTHRTPRSLPDAEVAEDSIEHVVGVNRADDVAEMFECLVQFDDHQILAKSQCGSVRRPLQCVSCGQQTVLASSRPAKNARSVNFPGRAARQPLRHNCVNTASSNGGEPIQCNSANGCPV